MSANPTPDGLPIPRHEIIMPHLPPGRSLTDFLVDVWLLLARDAYPHVVEKAQGGDADAAARMVEVARAIIHLQGLAEFFRHLDAAYDPSKSVTDRTQAPDRQPWMPPFVRLADPTRHGGTLLDMARSPGLAQVVLDVANRHCPRSNNDPSTHAFRGARAAIAAAVQCRMAAAMKRGARRYGLLSHAAAEVADRVKHKRLGKNRMGRASRAAYFASLWQQHATFLVPGSSAKDHAQALSRRGLYAAAIIEKMQLTWRLASSADNAPEERKWPADLEASKVFIRQAEYFEGLALMCLDLDAAERKQKVKKSLGIS